MKIKKVLYGVLFGLILTFVGINTVQAQNYTVEEFANTINNSPLNQKEAYNDFTYMASATDNNLILKVAKQDGSYEKDFEFQYDSSDNTLSLNYESTTYDENETKAVNNVMYLGMMYLFELSGESDPEGFFAKTIEEALQHPEVQAPDNGKTAFEMSENSQDNNYSLKLTIKMELSDKLYNDYVDYLKRLEADVSEPPATEDPGHGTENIQPGEENEDGTVTQPNTGIFDEYQWLLYLTVVGALTIAFLINKKRIHRI